MRIENYMYHIKIVLGTGKKLNRHKRFSIHAGRCMYVQCPVSRRMPSWSFLLILLKCLNDHQTTDLQLYLILLDLFKFVRRGSEYAFDILFRFLTGF